MRYRSGFFERDRPLIERIDDRNFYEGLLWGTFMGGYRKGFFRARHHGWGMDGAKPAERPKMRP